jgi:putative Ca2+/H+ antiporter (TMEM165/GDT1 family)
MDWKLLFLSFGLLFLAELGDKTQLAVFTLVAQYQKPWPIFIGASLALVAITLIAALFGNLITRYVPAQYLQLIAGLLFVGIGIFVLYSAVPDVLKYIGK